MKKTCPLIKSECTEHACTFYTHLIGIDPQTGATKDDWGCAITFLPILLVENANEMRKGASSTDKVANEVRNHHKTFLDLAKTSIRNQLENGSSSNIS